MTTTKLEVLKQFLGYVIDNKEHHYWHSLSTCHCGSLLMALDLYISANVEYDEVLNDVINEFQPEDKSCIIGYYKYAFQSVKNNHCKVTNLPFTKVVQKLLNYGFDIDELINLEHLQDKRFLNISVTDNSCYTVESLIQYLTNWIQFEEQLVSSKSKVPVSSKSKVPVMVTV